MLKGKHIVLTGAARGIGRAIALSAAEEGAVVGINYHRSASEAASLAEEIEAAGWPKPELLPFDATQSGEVENAIDGFVGRHGKIDGWVNNAAINISGLLPTVSEREIVEQVTSALIGPMICCRAVIPFMLREHRGSIVNMGSVVSRRPNRGQSVYAAAKGGLESFGAALAGEYGKKGIRVNSVLPGMIDTDMFMEIKKRAGPDLIERIPLARLGQSTDVAGAVVFLLSEKSAYITGASLPVDGGYSV